VALRGYIDGVIGDELVGWALDEDALASRVRVRGELDGLVLGTVEASEPRRDLATAGFGDGTYGFRIALDPGLLTPGVHRVAAIVGAEAVPLASDWIVRDGEDRPVESVQLTAAPATSAAETPRGDRAAPHAVAPQAAAVPDAEILVAGVGGWMFLIPAGAATRTHARLDAEAAAIEELHALARSLGTIAHAVAVPAKHLLYAEHVPPKHRPDAGRRSARAVTARLRHSPDASLHDLYDALQDARTHGRIYPRTGQTLTWVGAIQAYREIVKALPSPGLRPHSLDAFAFGALEPVADALGEDTEPSLTVRPAAAAAGAPTALVVHDATAGRIAELLQTGFSRCRVVVAERVDPRVVRAARADVVIWIREDR